MAKQSIIQRQIKREKLIIKYKEKRNQLLKEFSNTSSLLIKLNIDKKIEKLPRNRSKVR